jgi:hypothetical protein
MPSPSRAMKRALRTAPAVRKGQEMLEIVAKPKTRALLASHAKRGSPPVGAISGQLLKRFGPDVKLAPVKQFIGICVRAVLEEEGYRVVEKGVRLNGDPVFRTGSVYEPITKEPAQTNDALEIMLAALSDSHALRVALILEKAHPGLLRKALLRTR